MFAEARPRRQRQFEDFTASELYCPRCRRAMPVRSRLLLVLPDGELHEYLCQACATSVGTKTVRENRPSQVFIP
ncbi:MAG: hypothetical protein HGB17_12760 [Syntrophobacteraceae bacterium]|jgi:hypothetical protein|nr:hypothetical protein [Syntrophobacteraceae bacterium]